MQAPMTTRRLALLLAGVVCLTGLSIWRLTEEDAPRAAVAPPSAPLGAAGPRPLAAEAEEVVFTFGGQTMGTNYTVKYVTARPVTVAMAEHAVQAALSEVDASMSTYKEDSELSVFNRLPPHQEMPLSAGLGEVIALARRVHDQTDGAFDITVHPLVLAYGFGSSPPAELPDADTLARLEKAVGMEGLQFAPSSNRARKSKAGVSLDLGGIAKGYGVDQAAKSLERLGIDDYMVEVGGEIRVRGKKGQGQGWRLAIEEPRAESRELHGILVLPTKGAALATSGDYRNFRKMGDQVFSHTFDPRTKKPTPRRTASVSVVRESAAEADALATALSVLSPDEAIALANQHGWAVYLLIHQVGDRYEARQSEAFAALNFERQALSPTLSSSPPQGMR